MANEELPIDKKLLLTVNEAVKYSGIGIGTIRNLIKQENCPFVLRVGRKQMIRREAFERYLEERTKL